MFQLNYIYSKNGWRKIFLPNNHFNFLAEINIHQLYAKSDFCRVMASFQKIYIDFQWQQRNVWAIPSRQWAGTAYIALICAKTNMRNFFLSAMYRIFFNKVSCLWDIQCRLYRCYHFRWSHCHFHLRYVIWYDISMSYDMIRACHLQYF